MNPEKDNTPWIGDPAIRKIHNPVAIITAADQDEIVGGYFKEPPPSQTYPPLISGRDIAVFYKGQMGKTIWPQTIDLRKHHEHVSLSIGFFAWRRHVSSVLHKLKPADNIPEGDSIRANINGTAGEVVVAIATNRFYDYAIGGFSECGDVNWDEVKTRSEPWQNLFIDPLKIRDDRRYWLVVGNYPVYTVHGWTMGWIIKRHGRLVRTEFRGDKKELKKHLLFDWMPALDHYYHLKPASTQKTFSSIEPQ